MAAGGISIPIEVTGEKTFESALNALNAQMKAFQAGAEAAATSLSKMGDSEDATQKRTQSLNGLLEANQQKLELLKQKYQGAQDQLSKLAAAMEAAQKAGDPAAIDKATIAYNKQSATVAKLEADMAKTEKAITSTTAELQGMGTESESTGEKTSRLSQIMEGELVGRALSTLENALHTVEAKLREFGQGVMQFIGEASQYETSFAKVKTLADDTVVTYDELSRSIVDLSEKTGIAATEIAEATYQAISGGVDTAQAVSTVATASQLAAGGFTSTTSAIDVLTTAMNAYGISAEDSMAIADKLITTQNLGKTSVAELAQYIGRVIPVAASYGVSLDNLTSAYAILTASGINTANSTTYLASMFQELAKDGSGVSDILKNKTGKSFGELMASGMSLDDVLQILMEKANGNAEAFANLWGSQTAGLGALTLVNAGSEKYTTTLQAMQESAGSTEKAFETMSSTFEFSQQKLKTSMTNLKIALFQELREPISQVMEVASSAIEKVKAWAATPTAQEAVKRLADAISSMAEKLTGLLEPAINILTTGLEKAGEIISFAAEHVDLLIGAFVGLKAAIAALKFVQLINSLGQVASVVTSLGGTFASFGAGVAGIMSKVITAIGAINPVVAAIVVAVAAAAVLIIKNWDSIKEFAIKAWEGIKRTWNAAGEFFSKIGQAIEKALAKTVEWLGDTFTKAWEAVKKAWNAAGQFFQDVWHKITSALAEVPSWIGDRFREAWDGLTRAWSGVKDFFAGVFETIIGVFTGLPSKMLDVGKNAVKGIWEGIKNTEDWLFGKLQDFVGNTMDAIKGFFGIHSPSRLMRDEVGYMLGAGVAEGVMQSASLVQRAYKAMLPDPGMISSASDAFSSSVRSGGGTEIMRELIMDNRPIVLRLDDRELGRAVRGYV